ncbi:MAG: manganese efflux pump [Oscillospiraceae bacterium]|nr:manganese efflux pump [Oscillospiraceae bacterium]
MTTLELFLLAVGLAMDAFAVSICKGLAVRKVKLKHALICGAWFGVFQALMPALGYLLASTFSRHIQSIDHWVAFGLLSIIGGNMIREALSKKEEEPADASFKAGAMFLLAVATSIDALAVGVSFAFLEIRILMPVLLIGAITFVISAAGVKVGSVFGTKFEKKAELLGGVVLIILGVKILLEHLGVLG